MMQMSSTVPSRNQSSAAGISNRSPSAPQATPGSRSAQALGGPSGVKPSGASGRGKPVQGHAGSSIHSGKVGVKF